MDIAIPAHYIDKMKKKGIDIIPVVVGVRETVPKSLK